MFSFLAQHLIVVSGLSIIASKLENTSCTHSLLQ